MSQKQLAECRRRMKEAAVEIEGTPYLRRHVALELIGASNGNGTYYQRTGQVRFFVQEVDRSQVEMSGRRCWWLLEDCLALARRRILRRQHRPWTERERHRLYEMAGIYSMAEIAAKLKRSAHSVRCQMNHCGISTRGNALQRYHLITVCRLAEILAVRRQNVTHWYQHEGLPIATRRHGRREDPLFYLQEVRQWLIQRRDILALLPAKTVRMMRLTPADLADEREAVAA